MKPGLSAPACNAGANVKPAAYGPTAAAAGHRRSMAQTPESYGIIARP